MALTDSDLSELLAALKAGEMTDTIRTSLEWVLQQLIEAEATAFIGAAPHERTESRTAQRNGHRPRLLSTPAGDVELEIPKLRQGSFFPSLLERRRRIDRALYAVVMEAYVHGVSTRKVDDLVKALGVASGISKSEVSRICSELDRDLKAFRDRPLDHIAFPYVFLDATYVKGRVGGRVVSRAVVIATGVTGTGDREVLGIDVGDSEDGAFWTAFLKDLRARGLGGVELVISDHHLGLKVAIGAVFAKLRPAWVSDDDTAGRVKVVITGTPSDRPELRKHVRSKAGLHVVKDRAKDPDDALELVIVRDMWLTGFDSPSMHTMYVDKPMKGHSLMQAIARVNRTFEGKPGGLVVDCIGIAESLRAALANYTDRSRNEVGIPTDALVKVALEKHEVLSNLLHGHDWSKARSDKAAERLGAITPAVNFVLADPDRKDRFMTHTLGRPKRSRCAQPIPE